MNDKQWLERVTIAYNAYKAQVGPSLQIENFIHWLYQQYGIVEPEQEVKK
jgi:hypothetical protein